MSDLNSPRINRVPTKPEAEFDWRPLTMAMREKLWLIILLPILGGCLGYAYFTVTPPSYEARSTLEVEDRQRVLKFDEVTAEENQNSETLNTVAATIQSRTFLESVVIHEKFNERRDFFASFDPQRKPTVEEAVGLLSRSVRGAVRRNTHLINITTQHSKPEVARDMANAVAKGLIRFGLEQRANVANLANEVLMQEATRQRVKLQESEDALQRYRDEHKAVSLEQDQNLIVSQMKDLSNKLSAATSERVQLETDFAALKALESDPLKALQLPSVANNPTIIALGKALGEKKSELAVMSNRYKPKHPKYVALLSQINSLEEQVSKTLPEVTQQLMGSFEAAKINEEKYRKALSEQENKALELDRLAIQYNVLKREVDSNKAIYETVLSRQSEVDITKGIEQNNLKIHETAALPNSPSEPILKKIMLSSIGGGLLLAVGLIYLTVALDRTVKTVDQAERATALPVLAAVSRGKAATRKESLEIWKSPHSVIAESFRSLRAMASLLGREEERRIFLVTSAVPSEGKTYCATNYAISLAQQGLRTLLIDADLRKPSVSTLFYNEARKPGLTECLVGKVDFVGALHSTEMENLYIIPAGERAPNPAELLSTQSFKGLLSTALNHFDRIVIDSAPVIAVSDTLLIAPYVETVFHVLQWGRTPIPVVQRAIALLTEGGKAPSGIILNQLPQQTNSYYYYYSPGYYGSKGVYGAPAA